MNTQNIAVLVTANAITGGTDAKAPEWILYMPEGVNQINCSVNGKPASIEVKVTAETAARLQRDLEARRKSPVMPTLDFDHEGKRASGIPTAFKWEDGRGVLVEAGWTPSGNAAVVTKEWNYFSPQFAYDPKTKEVLGLLPTGPIGGLVNDPAFRALGAIMAHYQILAGDAGDGLKPELQHQPVTQNQTKKPMNDELLKVLEAAGLLTAAEASQAEAPTMLSDRLAALKKAKDEGATATAKCTALETELTAIKASQAADHVAAAVTAGAIAPTDAATKAFWTASIIRDGQSAVEALAKVKASHAVPADENLGGGAQRVTASAATKETELAGKIRSRAEQIQASSKVPFSTAWAQAQAEVGQG